MAGGGSCGGDDVEASVSVGVIIGIILAILASTASNLGVNVQKYSFIKEEEARGDNARPYVKQWRWWIGLSLVIFGAIGDFMAFALAPQTIVTPVGSFTLVTNVFFAHWWLKESLYKQDVIGTVLIVLGATLAVMFGDKSEACYTLEELLALYNRPAMYVYAALVLSALGVMYFVVKRSEALLKRFVVWEDVAPLLDEDDGHSTSVTASNTAANALTSRDSRSSSLRSGAGAGAGIGGADGDGDIEMVENPMNDDDAEGSRAPSADSSSPPGTPTTPTLDSPHKELAQHDSLRSTALKRTSTDSSMTSSRRKKLGDLKAKKEYEKYARLHPLCYAGLAGTFGAQTVMLAKSTAEILKTTIAGDSQLKYFFTYVILVGMFFTIAMEQHWLATGLKFFDALYVVPVFQAFFIGVSVLGGAVYFEEFSNFDVVQSIMFPLGVIMCLAGVLLLSMRSMMEDLEEEGDGDDDTEGEGEDTGTVDASTSLELPIPEGSSTEDGASAAVAIASAAAGTGGDVESGASVGSSTRGRARTGTGGTDDTRTSAGAASGGGAGASGAAGSSGRSPGRTTDSLVAAFGSGASRKLRRRGSLLKRGSALTLSRTSATSQSVNGMLTPRTAGAAAAIHAEPEANDESFVSMRRVSAFFGALTMGNAATFATTQGAGRPARRRAGRRASAVQMRRATSDRGTGRQLQRSRSQSHSGPSSRRGADGRPPVEPLTLTPRGQAAASALSSLATPPRSSAGDAPRSPDLARARSAPEA